MADHMADTSSDLRTLIRGAEHVVPEAELAHKLEEGRPLRVKLGVDPTAPDITLGWAVPLRKLRAFQNAGHTAVLIMGDFTARIGDPSGKSETRPQLSRKTVRANAEACIAQLLDILSEDNLEIRYNSEWLEPLDLTGVLRLTSHYTVAQMLERDDFSKRFDAHRPISMVEFMYPLLQAYDSVATKADVELGGTDQLFNLLVGRDLQRAFEVAPQVALTMPLLVGLDGVNKMSQSLGNYISIREDPAEMFGKLMSVPDEVLGRYALLAAEMDDAEVNELTAAASKGGPEAGNAKRKVGRAVVSLFHGREAAAGAEEAFDRQFRRHEVPEKVAEVALSDSQVVDGKAYLPALLAEAGLAASRSEARRLIAQGGVRVDGDQVQEESIATRRIRGAVVQVGKRRFMKVV
jgi:tyrosyl-tRNA synthetase